MKTHLLKEGALTENSAGIGTVTRTMVRERAVELAMINGRTAQDVTKSIDPLDAGKRSRSRPEDRDHRIRRNLRAVQTASIEQHDLLVDVDRQ